MLHSLESHKPDMMGAASPSQWQNEMQSAIKMEVEHPLNPRMFKVLIKDNKRGVLYLAFKKYIPLTGDIVPYFTKHWHKSCTITQHQWMEVELCCPEFYKKYNNISHRLYIPNILAK